ncbi:hypothetical protein KIN20_000305 [Parelaphostrongylus tenuis]|uniref:Potassium channel domain-containing protein n=1 Tax=Parelaphostrongylus tenuis TaxID=148309 RepID=A0AAD5MB13_PARTN|nr:hypothetical protein KIN20_000305 [Parelaphostrongylus tenuis]
MKIVSTPYRNNSTKTSTKKANILEQQQTKISDDKNYFVEHVYRMKCAMNEGEELNLNFWKKSRFRATFLHIGLVASCIAYIMAGAYLFQAIERPIELEMNKRAVSMFNKMNDDFLSKIKESDQDVEQTVDAYIENMLLLFENSHYAHVFETQFINHSNDKDIWTFPAAVLFTTTTIIPVGYGYVCPSSELGKILLIVYGIVGIPLALVTVANTGKFLSQAVSVWLGEYSRIKTRALIVSLDISEACTKENKGRMISRLSIRRKHTMLQQNSAKSHISKNTKEQFDELGVEILPPPAYNPEAVPSDYGPVPPNGRLFAWKPILDI